MDTLLFSFSVNCAADSVGEKFLQLRTWQMKQSQSLVMVTYENSIVYKRKLPCLSVSVSGLVVPKGIQSQNL